MNLKVRSQGAGPDLALIHGWGLPAAVWEPVVPALAQHFRVHCIDLPGYGDNRDVPPGSLALTADLVAAALPEKASLGAWSLGSHVAIGVLARHAAKVDKLVLIGSTPCFVRKPDWPHGIDPMLLDTFSFALQRGARTVLAKFAALMNQGDARARDLTRLLTALTNEPAAIDALTIGLNQLRDTDLRPLLAQVRRPTLLIHGDADPLMHVDGARWTADRISAARLEVFAGAAHAPFLSQPERFVASMCDFLADRAPGTC